MMMINASESLMTRMMIWHSESLAVLITESKNKKNLNSLVRTVQHAE